MNKTCLIMMAAYNGAGYIRQQLESIVGQTYKDWEMVVQDDGSDDGTIEILNEYARRFDNIRVWKNEGRRGAYYNFHSLINKCKKEKSYDFYMFADQDDIWLPVKIEYFMRYYSSCPYKNMPVLLYADMKLMDDNSRVYNESMNALFGMQYKNKWCTFYTHSVVGCNTFMNRALFEVAPPVDTRQNLCEIISHDNYYAKFAALEGRLIYIDKPLMLYRRGHDSVTASQDYGFKRILYRAGHFSGLLKSHARTYSQSLYAIEEMRRQDELPGRTYDILSDIRESLLKGGIAALKVFIRYDISCGKCIKTFSRAFVLITGAYTRYLYRGGSDGQY